MSKEILNSQLTASEKENTIQNENSGLPSCIYSVESNISFENGSFSNSYFEVTVSQRGTHASKI